MYYVYIIKSLVDESQIYVGYTTDLKQRVSYHNSGKSLHTSKYKPWRLVWYAAFCGQSKAIEFEKYLKSGSGRAFLHKRFV